jgi:two-component system response regulator FixJ
MRGPVAIVDDDEAVCDALTAMLESNGFAARTCMTIAGLRELLAIWSPPVVLLDIKLPDGSGVDILPELGAIVPSPAVIMMTGHGDVALAVAAMKAGARDFLEKPFDPMQLLAVIDNALASAEANAAQSEAEIAARETLAALTPRERQVLANLVDGASSKEIARRLSLSPRTVEAHRGRLMAKTGARSLSTLLRLAILAGVKANGEP